MEYVGNSSILVIDEYSFNPVLKEERIVITDKDKYNVLLKELRDLSSCYVDTFNAEYSCILGVNSDYSRFNPRESLYRLVSGEFGEYFSLFSLFKYLVNMTPYDLEKEWEWIWRVANNLLNDSSLSKDDLVKVFKRMYPAFGLFATEGLNCIDFEVVKTYPLLNMRLDEESRLSEFIMDPSKKVSGQYTFNYRKKRNNRQLDLEQIIENNEKERNAKNNGNVLNLARKINKGIFNE